MRRLRAFLPFAGRRTRAVGVDTRPGPMGPGSGRVDRRRLLGLIGSAPIALSAAARTVAEPGFLTLGMDVQRSGRLIGSAVFFSDAGEVSDLVMHAGLYPTDLSGLTYADLPSSRVVPDSVPAIVRQERASWAARGLDRLPAAAAAPFIDDVGSGP